LNSEPIKSENFGEMFCCTNLKTSTKNTRRAVHVATALKGNQMPLKLNRDAVQSARSKFELAENTKTILKSQ